MLVNHVIKTCVNIGAFLEINNKITIREKDLHDAREEIEKKEEEIIQLRAKTRKIQNDVTRLRGKRTDRVDACVILEKRIKTVEEQTGLFQSMNADRSDI